ncbi:MAG: AsnC family transcriptional regulator [Thermoproteota archaeon]|nr:AsnC family transcriptional regulator [Thermoproteota archaeon]
MHTTLDKIDLAIINSLMKDGRKSFRQISREIKVSTPTVEARFTRLKKLGIIKNVQPIFDLEKLENCVLAITNIKTNPLESSKVIEKLESISEITVLYSATGENNLLAKIITFDKSRLEQIIQKISNINGIKSLSYQIIVKIIKDSSIMPIDKEISLKISCDYCDNHIYSPSSKTLSVGNFEKYFCCNSCLILYKQKCKLE